MERLQLNSFCPGAVPEPDAPWLQGLVDEPEAACVMPAAEPEPEVMVEAGVARLPMKRKRARIGGKFRADDPSTPELNEAWETREN